VKTAGRLEDLPGPVVLAAGAFDGVHRGHQAVVEEARRLAGARGAQAWALTFDPHPLRILRPSAAPALLTSPAHKLLLLEQTGLGGCVVLPFTAELADVEPEAFIARLCQAVPGLVGLVVGSNWTFGHRARGNVHLLRQLAAGAGFEAVVVEGILWRGHPISSTRIRRAVRDGHLDDAAQMLGRPFSVLGPVVHGGKLGRKLGFPTANVRPDNEVRPPAGIYAVQASVLGRWLPGAAYLAGDDSADERHRDVVEVYLLDQPEGMDLYGAQLEIRFVRKMRDERRFTHQEDLMAQIARDIEDIRAALAAVSDTQHPPSGDRG
jgi:riboflavin kinase / FMN adenylyltransferase